MSTIISQEKINEAKTPKTRTEKKSILEGKPNVSEAFLRVYKNLAIRQSSWLVRYFYYQLYTKMLVKDNSDEIFGHTTLVSNLKVFMQGVATYCDRHPERIPDLCAAMAGVETLKESWQMTAKEARKHIRNTPVEELEGFFNEEYEDRKTVVEAWIKKLQDFAAEQELKEAS